MSDISINKSLDFKNKKVFFSGYGEKIEKEELLKYLIQNNAKIVDEYKDSDIIIQGFKTPVYLEDKFYLLSKDGIDVVTIQSLEKQFSKDIDIDSIILAVKISKDNTRVVKLLNNRYFSDDVFLKLLKFYDWNNEGLYDSDQNRDVSTAVVQRFSKIQDFNHNIKHSPIGIYYTALEAVNPKLLEAIYNMPNYSISEKNAKKDQPISLKEVVALNPNSSKPLQMQILKNKNKNELEFLALNSSINKLISLKLYETLDQDIIKNLIISNNLEAKFLNEALHKLFENKNIFNEILKTIQLSELNFNTLIKKDLTKAQLVYLSSNKSLTLNHIKILFEYDIENININLLKNKNCPKEFILSFLNKDDLIYNIAIAHNEALDDTVYKNLFEKNDLNIDISLAINNKTPEDILKKLFKKNIYEIDFNLSKNKSTPINILLNLQVDNNFNANVSNNETYKEFSRNNLGIIKEENNRFKRDTYGDFWD